MLVIQRRRVSGLRLPGGSGIMWFGSAAQIPDPWSVDQYIKGYFVQGAPQGGASNTGTSASHSHSNPSTTNSGGSHSHSASGTTTSGPSGSSIRQDIGGDIQIAGPHHTHAIVTGQSTSSGGSHSHALSSTGSASPLPPYLRLYFIKTPEDAELPVGGVVIWDDLAGNIPDGFAICDGSNGTPDLRNRFVYGAAGDSDVGLTGGSQTHTHSNSSTGSVSNHSHSYSIVTGYASNYVNQNETSPYTSIVRHHRHYFSSTTPSGGGHSHALGNTGSANHMPAYIKLYYIMRIN